MTTLRDRFRGCMVGLAVGDALGASVEFMGRDRVRENPVTGMRGGGPWGLRPGDWTDDTSMAFALGDSLAQLGRFDPRDVMTRWLDWLSGRRYCGTHGRGCFDVGGTTAAALRRFGATGDPYQGNADPWGAANGCLMRLAPMALYAYGRPADVRRGLFLNSSRLTHGHPYSLGATLLFGELLVSGLAGGTALEIPREAVAPDLLERLYERRWRDADDRRISSTGFVVDTFEAALWACYPADGFAACVLRAANLGGDADTVGAVAGQLAGAWYGYSAIPADWLDVLDRREELVAIADELYELVAAGSPVGLLAAADAPPDPLPGHAAELGEAGA